METGLAIDRGRLLLEDSFLGEMLRLAGRSGGNDQELEELISTALRPLMENQELRKLLMSTGSEEKRDWLSRAAELGTVLLSGVEEQAGVPQGPAAGEELLSARASGSLERDGAGGSAVSKAMPEEEGSDGEAADLTVWRERGMLNEN